MTTVSFVIRLQNGRNYLLVALQHLVSSLAHKGFQQLASRWHDASRRPSQHVKPSWRQLDMPAGRRTGAVAESYDNSDQPGHLNSDEPITAIHNSKQTGLHADGHMLSCTSEQPVVPRFWQSLLQVLGGSLHLFFGTVYILKVQF